MTKSIEVGIFHECLRSYERYQVFATTVSLSFLFLTWKWPWAGKTLIDPPTVVPQVDPINIGLIPLELSVTVAISILLAAYLVTSCLALFCIGRAKSLGCDLSNYGADVVKATMRFPSLATHDEKIVRIGMPMAISILIFIAISREFWWEGNTLWPAMGKGLLLSLIILIPQLLTIGKLWNPLASSRETLKNNR